MSRVAVIDYGMGNLHSVAKAIEHAAPEHTKVVVTHDRQQILNADRVVLPGVGAIRDCMAEIRRLGIDEIVAEVVRDKPLLGVCVGMQALLTHSDENGGVDGFNLIPGHVRFFSDHLSADQRRVLKVPHMGWNQVHQRYSHPLWQGINQNSRFYFVHSYFASTENPDDSVANSTHGVTFTAAIQRENIFAVQFHPEKSQHAGLQLYANFLNWDGMS